MTDNIIGKTCSFVGGAFGAAVGIVGSSVTGSGDLAAILSVGFTSAVSALGSSALFSTAKFSPMSMVAGTTTSLALLFGLAYQKINENNLLIPLDDFAKNVTDEGLIEKDALIKLGQDAVYDALKNTITLNNSNSVSRIFCESTDPLSGRKSTCAPTTQFIAVIESADLKPVKEVQPRIQQSPK